MCDKRIENQGYLPQPSITDLAFVEHQTGNDCHGISKVRRCVVTIVMGAAW